MGKIDNREIKILIVDDTTFNLEIAGKILQKEDYDIYVADSGETALELVDNVQFDLILLDIMMPVMDGFETCKRIKDKPEYANIPIIFLSARVEIDSIIKGFQYGAVDYIRKPFNDMELIARVRTHVELKKTREQLERENKKLEEAYALQQILATTDPLTKLINRREVLRLIEHEKNRYERNKTPFTIIVSDIDFFKRVNDNYGHECGDVVLCTVAEILKSSTRKQDYVSRWGGEEFLILLPDTALEGGVILAEKLRGKIQKKVFRYGDDDFTVTMTFGVSSYSDNKTIDKLINEADEALYKGKENGRNQVVRL